ncbi:hypothetical protein C7B80_16655 [Cyanosarcina cf. burmensis CCALA 770]|nr:hypothetical protein C7B80_16655 [Cyanosarcina cf. burmensis CCALA 770]
MTYTEQDLQNQYGLSKDVVRKTLKACGLSVEQATYSDEEIQSRFLVARKLLDDKVAHTYADVADYFKQQDGVNSEDNTKEMPQLLSLASEQCGTRISLTQAVRLLEVCGLADKDRYTPEEVERFLEACNLLKGQGKTMAEVAAHFGQPSGTVENAQAILDEIIGLVGQVSDTQAERIRSLLPQLAAEQLEQIKVLFSRMTMQRLREMMTTGEMDAQFQQVWNRQSGNDFDLVARFESTRLNQQSQPKSLPGLSMNSSTSG